MGWRTSGLSPVVRFTCGSMGWTTGPSWPAGSPPLLSVTSSASRGLVERAAVGERGVPVGELERRHQHVALPDREVGAVAAAPELVVGRGSGSP